MCAVQASGKGTLGERVASAYKLEVVASGDLLRRAIADGTEIGKKAEATMAAGGTISLHVFCGSGSAPVLTLCKCRSRGQRTCKRARARCAREEQGSGTLPLLSHHIHVKKSQSDMFSLLFRCGQGIILDGFPRTAPQAVDIDQIFADRNISLVRCDVAGWSKRA